MNNMNSLPATLRRLYSELAEFKRLLKIIRWFGRSWPRVVVMKMEEHSIVL